MQTTLTPHPNDPSVLVTSLTEQFLDQSTLGQFPARILTRAEEQKSILREAAEQVWQAMTTDDDFATAIAKTPDDIEIDYLPEALAPMKDQITQWSSRYRALSGHEDIEITIGKAPIGKKRHPHDYAVYNCNIFCLGTNWYNATGQKSIVPECADFYFPEDFWHASTVKTPDEKRITAVLTPLGIL